MKRYNKKFHKRQEMFAKQQPLNRLGYNQSFELDKFFKLLGRECGGWWAQDKRKFTLVREQ